MSELPVPWAQGSIGDVAESMKNGVYKPADAYAEDGIACLRMYNVEGGKIVWRDIKRMRLSKEDFEMYRLLPGDLLVNRVNSRELVGKAAMIPAGLEPCVFESKNIRLRLRTNLVDPKFVAFKLLLDGSRHFANNAQQVVGMASISQPQLAAFPIPLPPLAEQKRIVAKIEELFSELEAGEESLRVARRQLGVYRQSLLKQAFEGHLTAKWRTQNPAKLESPAQLLARIQSARQARYERQLKEWEAKVKKWENGSKEDRKPAKPSRPVPSSELKSSDELPLHKLPDSWIWLRFDSAYAESVLGKMLDAEKNRGEPRPYLRNINVRWGRFDLDDLLLIKIEETEIDRYRVVAGDLVICEGGEPGRCAVWPENHDEVVFLQKALHRVRFPELISPFYIELLISFLAGTKLLERHFTGTTIKHLTGEGLAGVPVPICSLPEQQEIVRLLDEQFEVIERNEREIDGALRKSEALRQAILQKAFTGRLVPQNPADEPASTLLARLRAERGTPTGNTTSRDRKTAAPPAII